MSDFTLGCLFVSLCSLSSRSVCLGRPRTAVCVCGPGPTPPLRRTASSFATRASSTTSPAISVPPPLTCPVLSISCAKYTRLDRYCSRTSIFSFSLSLSLSHTHTLTLSLLLSSHVLLSLLRHPSHVFAGSTSVGASSLGITSTASTSCKILRVQVFIGICLLEPLSSSDPLRQCSDVGVGDTMVAQDFFLFQPARILQFGRNARHRCFKELGLQRSDALLVARQGAGQSRLECTPICDTEHLDVSAPNSLHEIHDFLKLAGSYMLSSSCLLLLFLA